MTSHCRLTNQITKGRNANMARYAANVVKSAPQAWPRLYAGF